MLPKLAPHENQFGSDLSGAVPAPEDVGVHRLPADHAAIWRLASPYLKTRGNDGHTIYAYGVARALCDLHAGPEVDAEIVLASVLLHDTGWSQVPEDEVLAAIAPGHGRPDLVLLHEREGARIATEVLAELGWPADRILRVVEIIDGHDSRPHALHLEDALMKDADKLWRITPHGLDTVMDWFGLDREAAHALVASRVHDHLFTDTARTLAAGFGAVASVDVWPERIALG
jgi:hypothetical protein